VSYYYEGVTDTNGVFVLDRVVPGELKVAHKVRPDATDMAYGHAELIEVKAGEAVGVTIGGAGIELLGRLVMPEDYNEPVDWAYARGTLSVKLAESLRPDGFEQMSDQEMQMWVKAWRESEQGKAYERSQWEKSRSYVVEIEKDGTFRVQDVPTGLYELQINLYAQADGIGLELGEVIGSLNDQFEIADIHVESSTEPLDIGTFTIQMREGVSSHEDAGPF
jgi:hypothetical protein